MLLVSASPETRDVVRSLVLQSGGPVEFSEAEFQPEREQGGFWTPHRQVPEIEMI
jgi:hypothetical protein